MLLALSFAGLLWPADYRDRFPELLLPYGEAVRRVDEAWVSSGYSAAFVEEAVRTWDAATAYEWPEGYARVSARDNWILAAAAWLDPLLRATGLEKDAVLFGQFESFRYERALGRGFGICSQHALGFADLLYRRYGVDARPIGLGGHVVTRIVLRDGRKMIADPSIGLTLPFSLSEAEADLEPVRAAYRAAGHAALAETYDQAGNVRAPTPGGAPYAVPFWKMNAVRWFERLSDVLKWLMPVAMLAAAWPLARGPRGRRSSRTAAAPTHAA